MKLSEVVEILGAKVLAGEDALDTEVASACGCDPCNTSRFQRL